MKLKTEDIVGRILAGVFFLAIVSFLTFFIAWNIAMSNATQAAVMTLRNQADTNYHGVEAKFTRGEMANIAVATCWAGTVMKQDLNKSRIAGEWIGEKSKEVVKGIKDGLMAPLKHKDEGDKE